MASIALTVLILLALAASFAAGQQQLRVLNGYAAELHIQVSIPVPWRPAS